MPKEYTDCVDSMCADGHSKEEAQKQCAIQYYKKHGKTPQQAAGEFTDEEDKTGVGGEEKEMSAHKEEIIERDAKIFEAGKWEDKDLEVTEEELDTIVKGFKEAPIKVEHVDSPLHLGTVSKIWREGKDLMGKLSLVKPAWDLLEISGAKKLSSCIKRDKSALVEVSVVRNPRIADAAVYSMDEENGEEVGIRFEVDLPEQKIEKKEEEVKTPEKKEVDLKMTDKKYSIDDVAEARRILASFRPSEGEAKAIFDTANELVQYVSSTESELKETASRAKAAMMELQRANADRLIEQFKRNGKITPASEKFARAILLSKPLAYTDVDDGAVVSFKNDADEAINTHFAEAFVKFLEALPAVVSFQELAKQQAKDEAMLSGEEAAWLESHLGVKKEDVVKYNR